MFCLVGVDTVLSLISVVQDAALCDEDTNQLTDFVIYPLDLSAENRSLVSQPTLSLSLGVGKNFSTTYAIVFFSPDLSGKFQFSQKVSIRFSYNLAKSSPKVVKKGHFWTSEGKRPKPTPLPHMRPWFVTNVVTHRC